ncbi:MAG TPA: hypothetical protein VFI24_05685 [Pyrinomonadaceae bacterium]|nr:hypothetical protein [Pyrinomonadaceae bacterium]
MILKRLTAIVFVIGLLGVVSEARSQQKEVRGKLFKQVLADYPDVRECVQQEEGGTRTAEENMSVTAVDLNRDGVSEYRVELSGPCVCGMVNCSIYIYRQTPAGYESILDDASGLGLVLLKTSSNGYADVRVDARDSAAAQSRTVYKFDGKRYREATSTLVNPQTGESKPASQRVQFKRGASSATVQGRVSLELSDTWVIGARAGQVMTVQLTSPNRSVRFMLMTSRTTTSVADNTRSWTGTLPDTDDYLILVDTGAKTASYSMTITIK